MTYYIKKLRHQELGSVGEDGRPNRGRYFLTSSDERVLSYFPYLSKTQLNDSALLAIIPLYLEDNKKVYCNYVYHNDKFHGSTARHPRNEYRIYLNKELENMEYLFKEDDIVVFKKAKLSTNGSQDEDYDQTVYYLDLINKHSTPYYDTCNLILLESNIRGNGYAIHTGPLEAFEKKASRFNKIESLSVEIDSTVIQKIVSGTTKSIDDLFTSASFRDFVLTGYSNSCAVSGKVIKWNNLNNLEAAHIKPKSQGGSFRPNNGIALCRDMHWAFDKGFFTIEDDLTIKVHPDIESDFLKSFDGKKVAAPTDVFVEPDKDNLRYHREKIYGVFKTSGNANEY